MKTAVSITFIAALISFASANAIPASPSYTPPTKTYKEIANFDDIGSLNAPYKHLSWAHLAVTSPISKLPPQSADNYALSEDGSATVPATRPSISINGTKTSSFDITQFYTGCFAYDPKNPDGEDHTGFVAAKCQLSVHCDQRPSGQAGPFLYTVPLAREKMQKLDVGLYNCSNAYVDLISSSKVKEFTYVAFDNFKLVTRQGETF